MKTSKSTEDESYELCVRHLRSLYEESWAHNPSASFANAHLYDKLIKQCKTLHRLYECQCNGCTRDKLKDESWKAYDEARKNQMDWVEKRIEKVQKTITKKLEELGLKLNYFNPDPRGHPVYIILADNSYNTFGGMQTGYGIGL